MTSLLSRLVSSLRDIRIPFPMTQAPAAPSVSAIADPATGTVDIGGIIYQLESLVAAYQGVLKQATEQLESFEIPEDLQARLVRAARGSAQDTIRCEIHDGHLMDDQIREQIKAHVGHKLSENQELINIAIQLYVNSRSEAIVRDAVHQFIAASENELVEAASRRVDHKVANVESDLERNWATRFERLVSDRGTLKRSLLTLLGDDMRELAREILADERNNQPAL